MDVVVTLLRWQSPNNVPNKSAHCPWKTTTKRMDVDDEDLYGPDAVETPQITIKEHAKPREMSEREDEGEEGVEDVYEEDDLEIIVGGIDHGKPAQQQPYRAVNVSKSTEEIGSVAPVMNIHAIGTLDPSTMTSLPTAIPIIDADLEDEALFEDRPWRRPGADLTDYFNFGFDEQSWKEYCTKQRALREEQATKRRIGLVVDAAAPSSGMAKWLHLGTGGKLPGMLPPLPPFLPPPPPWILQQGQHGRDREHRGEHRESTREHRDRDRGEHREHHRESTRDRDSHRRESKEGTREGRSSHRDSRGSSSRHSSRRSASPAGQPSRTSGGRK
jgi:Fip1 motif protein